MGHTEDPQRLAVFQRIIARLPHWPTIDLGAGHCQFALLAHEAGFPVVAMDARPDRVPPNLPFPFVQGDVRKLTEAELAPYPIILLLGLLYHLELPDQEALLAKCRGKTVVVDTHEADREFCKDSPLRTVGPYQGMDYRENASLQSSIDNPLSFWHTRESLELLFRNHGFEFVKYPPGVLETRSFWLLTSAGVVSTKTAERGMIRVGTCITESYLDRATSCLRSLPDCGADPFVVTYGFHADESTRRAFPGLQWHHLPAGQPADCNGCVQYGAWLDVVPHEPGDVLVMADADAVFQRGLDRDELAALEALGDNQVAVGPNAGLQDTLQREAARLRRGGTEPTDQILDGLYPGFANVPCRNCGFIAARATWWHRLRPAFVEAWPAFDRLFSYRARCQWLTCWLMHVLGSTIRLLPYSMHAHQHFGVPPGCRIDGRPPTVLCGDRLVFFAHHFMEILR